ncbi:DUF4368 domain-containing protein, partial [Faecalibacterium prausnitzii]
MKRKEILKNKILIRKCKNPTEISDSMFNELVDKIVVYEA